MTAEEFVRKLDADNQALLEGHRAHPEEDQIFDDLLKARAAMERAWLELLAAAPSPEG